MKNKPLNSKIKKMFDKWSMLDDVRTKALNPETLEILLNIILKENKKAVEKLKEEVMNSCENKADGLLILINMKIDKIFGRI